MNITDLAVAPLEKTGSKALWRMIRRPLFGIERAAPGSQRQLGQMSAKTEGWVGNEATRSGMARDTENTLLEGWWKNNRELAESYGRAHPDAKPFLQASPDRMSKFKQFEEGVGQYEGRISQADRIDAQRLRDLEHAYAGFGKDQQALVELQKDINKLKADDLILNKPGLILGGGAGGYAGYESDGSMQSVLTGAALGAGLGMGVGKGITRLTRNAGASEAIALNRSMQRDIANRHGKGLLGANLKYMGRRITDPILQRGRFDTLGERLRFGRLGGGHILGRGYELLKARAAQGGLLGKGGLIRGGIAWDPRLGMNARLLGHALRQGQYGQAARLGKDLVIGSAVQTGKFGLMGAMPAYGVYSELSDPNNTGGSLAGRVGKAVGTNFGGVATFPLGVLTWAPSMLPGQEHLSLGHQIGNVAQYAGDMLSAGAAEPPTTNLNRSPRGLYVGNRSTT